MIDAKSPRSTRIIFRFRDDTTPALGAKNVKLTLHEALCKAIYERDPVALKWLSDNIVDIGL